MIIIYKSTKNYIQMGNLFYFLANPLTHIFLRLIKSKRTRVILLNKKSGEIILVKNWFGNGVYQLPGGGVKRGEETVYAAKREIQEELGIKLYSKKMKVIKTVDGKNYKKQFILTDFILNEEAIDSLQIAQHEIVEVIKLKLSEVKKLQYKLDEDTYHLLNSINYRK